jgi:hypothetical protein
MGPATPAHAHVARQGLSGDRRKARSKAELELVFQAVTTAGSVPCPSPFAGDDLEQTHIGSLGFVSWRLITPRNNAEWRTFLKLRDRVADGGRLRGYAGPPFPYSQDPAVVGLTIVSAARHSNRRIESRRRRSFRRLDSSAPSSRGRRPIAHGLQIGARSRLRWRAPWGMTGSYLRVCRRLSAPKGVARRHELPTIFGTSMPNMRCSARRCRLIEAWRLICRLFCGCSGCRWWSSSC